MFVANADAEATIVGPQQMNHVTPLTANSQVSALTRVGCSIFAFLTIALRRSGMK